MLVLASLHSYCTVSYKRSRAHLLPILCSSLQDHTVDPLLCFFLFFGEFSVLFSKNIEFYSILFILYFYIFKLFQYHYFLSFWLLYLPLYTSELKIARIYNNSRCFSSWNLQIFNQVCGPKFILDLFHYLSRIFSTRYSRSGYNELQ